MFPVLTSVEDGLINSTTSGRAYERTLPSLNRKAQLFVGLDLNRKREDITKNLFGT